MQLSIAAVILLAAGLIAYANSFSGAFVFDDIGGIVDNPHVRRLWPLIFTLQAPPDAPSAGRPVIAYSLALNYFFGALNPWGYHLFSVVMHWINACLLCAILRRTFSIQRFSQKAKDASAGLALSITLVWLAHPLLTESVTYVSQRTELVVSFFILAALYCAIRAAFSARYKIWRATAVACCFLGTLSKEVMAAAPLIIFAYDAVFLSSSWRKALKPKPVFYTSLALTWIPLAWIIATNPRPLTVSVDSARWLTPLDYARTQCGIILHYLRLAVWPNPLTLDYTNWPVSQTWAAALPHLATIAGLIAVTLWALCRQPGLGFAGAWFFLILFPSSGVVPIVGELAAERRMYLPLAAVVALAVLAVWKAARYLLSGEVLRRWAYRIMVAVCVIFFAQRSALRNKDYVTEVVLWQKTVAQQPESSFAHASLCAALLAEDREVPAFQECAQALALDPRRAEAHLNLGLLKSKQGQSEEAVAHYGEILRMNPRYVKAHANLGIELIKLNRLSEAEAQFAHVLKLEPTLAQGHYNLGNILAKQYRFSEAASRYEEALWLQPRLVEARNNLGNIFLLQGELDKAKQQYEQALQLNPQHLQARANLRRLVAMQENNTPQ